MPRRSLAVRVAPALVIALSGTAVAAPWEPRPGVELAGLDGVAQKVELLDVDADGWVDIVLAHSRGDAIGGDADAQLPQLLHNESGLGFTELAVFDDPVNAYAIKAGDLDGDGDPDLVVGVNFQGQSFALMSDGDAFTRQDIFPGQDFSVGDLELADVDGDGVLDIVAVDWGAAQPYGDLADPGGPVRLWLGVGDGTFFDAQMNLPMGLDNLASWSFDVELADIDGDFDLDILVSSRGPGNAFALRNDGDGVFAPHPLPALQEIKGKDINAAFAPIDLDGDGDLDVLTLQDGGEDCELIDGAQVCGSRNSALIGDGMGQFADNPGGFWSTPANPLRRDADVATLDLDNSGTPDVVVVGPPQYAADVVGRISLNSGLGLDPTLTVPFPADPALHAVFGLMFADFDRDGREDVALAIRSDQHPSVVLFGGDDPLDGIPVDIEPPTIGQFEALPDLFFATQEFRLHARVDDRKTPTRWHDFRYDPDLDTYNLSPGTVTAHRRRLPWIEYAVGLSDPQELDALPDTGPAKTIVPGVWFGESLWRFDVTAPIPQKVQDTLTWRLCAMDAAGNRGCVGPFESTVEIPVMKCGDGVVDPWEECDNPFDPLCVQCMKTCGDGVCAGPETTKNCLQDCPCNHDGVCDPPLETRDNCDDCGGSPSVCGDGVCQAPPENAVNCAADCAPVCGDCVCEPPEDAANCAIDCEAGTVCAKCGDGLCETPDEHAGNCPKDCPSVCGDCICVSPEDAANCPSDCSALACGCGDGICGIGEPSGCPEDCPQPTTGDVDDTTDSASSGPGGMIEAGCGCRGGSGGAPWLALLLLLPRRRRKDMSSRTGR